MRRTRITLNELARLDRQLQRDGDIPLRQLRERDRAIGTTLPNQTPRTKLLAWLDQVARESDNQRHLSGLETAIGFWLTVIGTLCGVLAMAGLLLVEAQQPVNILMLLTLFVGTQFLLLLLTLVVALNAAAGKSLHLPFENLNPARLLFRRLLNRLAGTLRWDQIAGVGRLALLRWGQLFGVAFNLGGLIAFLVILLVTDRSFGWSSTLNVTSSGLHTAMQWLAAPWASWLPQATVSSELVQATRYQALQTAFGPEQVIAMRQWWPFLFACVMAYGLMPRLLLWFLFAALYRRQLHRAFVSYPGVALVLDRLNSPLVNTRANHSEETRITNGEPVSTSGLPAGANITLIDWAGALKQSANTVLDQAGLQPVKTLAAGLDLEDDQKLLGEVKHADKLVIAVKGWEPPLGELADFIRALDQNADCYLLLVSLPNRELEKNEITDWQQFARELPHRRTTILRGDQPA